MTSKEVWLVKILLGTGSALFAVLATVVTCIKACRDENYEIDRTTFHRIWHKIHESRWLTMPENVVYALLKVERKFAKLADKVRNIDWLVSRMFGIGLSTILLIAPWYCWSRSVGLVAFVVSLPASIFLITKKIDKLRGSTERFL